MNVLGETYPDPLSQLLGTNLFRFRSPTGLNGLAKIVGEDRLDLVAVDALIPGTGQFRTFINRAKEEFSTLCIWEVWNPVLEEVLPRYGFHPHKDTDADTGEKLEGYRWMKVPIPASPQFNR